jgi:8-amino-7-oxononanoate synthase
MLKINLPSSLIRKRHLVEKIGNHLILVNQQPLIHFCSNDYLGMATHPSVIRAYTQGAEKYGVGSGSAALISGYSKPHQLLEETFANMLNRDRALLFNSGYHANLGVITTFANKSSTIIADKHCHASIIDGIILSRAKHKRYHHNDYAHAETLLASTNTNNTLLITESVFSMSGGVTNLSLLSKLAAQYNANLIVDDAHGFGILSHPLSQQDVPCLMIPFGKSLGSMGAIVSGSHDTIETLLQGARSYRYSTALPPATCCATLEALTILAQEPWRRIKLQQLSAFFINEARSRHLILAAYDETPIKSILIGTNTATVSIQEKLMQDGFYVSCIRPPTVPVNSARIRISLNCFHTEEQITALLDKVKEHYDAIKA